MFHFNFGKKDNNIYAPVQGKMIPLQDVPDKTFADRLLGDGAAFYSDTDLIYAPCKGKVTMIAQTKHALGLLADNGAELLIHVGLETVALNGEGFELLVGEGDRITPGKPMMRVNRKLMEEKKINLVIPMIVTNEQPFQLNAKDTVGLSDSVFTMMD